MKWSDKIANQKVRQRLRYLYLIVLLLLWIAMIGSNVRVKEGKAYTDFDHVALYILEFNDVPENYITGYMMRTPYRYDVFHNNEELLPLGHTYTEVYINATMVDYGAERFVFSDDELFYTLNHYASFTDITKNDILGGYYLFGGLFYTSLLGGVILIGLMLALSKEVTVHELKKDIHLDYNLLKDKYILVRDKTKEAHKKWKHKRESKKSVEE